jgi:prophage regulatory protein
MREAKQAAHTSARKIVRLSELDADQLLSMAEIAAVTGLGMSTLFRARLKGGFPKPIHLSRRAVKYTVRDVKAWIAARGASA